MMMIRKIIVGFILGLFIFPLFVFAAENPIFYTASWCGPCNTLKGELDKSVPGWRKYVTLVDTDTLPAGEFRPQSIPAIYSSTGSPINNPIFYIGNHVAQQQKNEPNPLIPNPNPTLTGGLSSGQSGSSLVVLEPPLLPNQVSLQCSLNPAKTAYICKSADGSVTTTITIGQISTVSGRDMSEDIKNGALVRYNKKTSSIVIAPPTPPRPSNLPSTLPLVPGDPGYVPPVAPAAPVPPKIEVVSRKEESIIDKKTGLFSYRITVLVMVTSGNPPKTKSEKITVDASTVAKADDLIKKELERMQLIPPTPEPKKYYTLHDEITPYHIDGVWVVKGQICDGGKCTPLSFTIPATDAAGAKKAIEEILKNKGIPPKAVPGVVVSPKPQLVNDAKVTPNGRGQVKDPFVEPSAEDLKKAEIIRKTEEQRLKNEALEKRLKVLEGEE